MNKPITSKKFASDLWDMMQMAIEEAVLAEREACAKLCEGIFIWSYDDPGETAAKAIRARGEQA